MSSVRCAVMHVSKPARVPVSVPMLVPMHHVALRVKLERRQLLVKAVLTVTVGGALSCGGAAQVTSSS